MSEKMPEIIYNAELHPCGHYYNGGMYIGFKSDEFSDGCLTKYVRSDLCETDYLLSVLAEIRHKTGVGDSPMLSELADAIVEKMGGNKE